MASAPSPFRYVADPHANAFYLPGPNACVGCGRMLPGYFAIWLRDDEEERGYDQLWVCEQCLLQGRLIEMGLRLSEGDLPAIEAQLACCRPDLSEERRKALARERTVEVEQRTPRAAVLQPFIWPAHCGDYYRFLKSLVTSDELNRLAPDGNGKVFFAAHLLEPGGEDAPAWIDAVWDTGLSHGSFIRAYLWQCTVCGRYAITWDHD